MTALPGGSRSLIAEPPLLVLPSLAVAVGLNQAILLQQLHFLSLVRRPDRGGHRWVELGNADLLHTFPFWSRNTVWRMVWQLRDLGMVTVREEAGSPHRYRLEYAAIELAVAMKAPRDTVPNMGRDPAQNGETTLPNLGRPTIKELEERKSSKQLATDESDEQGPSGPAPLEAMTLEWEPDETTRGVLYRMGVPKPFADEVLPEFRLYWLERACAKPWGSTFVAHVRRQWANRTVKPSAGHASDKPYPKPGDTISGKMPDAKEVLAKSAPNPDKLASPETIASHLAAIKESLRA